MAGEPMPESQPKKPCITVESLQRGKLRKDTKDIHVGLGKVQRAGGSLYTSASDGAAPLNPEKDQVFTDLFRYTECHRLRRTCSAL